MSNGLDRRGRKLRQTDTHTDGRTDGRTLPSTLSPSLRGRSMQYILNIRLSGICLVCWCTFMGTAVKGSLSGNVIRLVMVSHIDFKTAFLKFVYLQVIMLLASRDLNFIFYLQEKFRWGSALTQTVT